MKNREDIFESFSEDEQEFKNLAPRLFSIKKENPFQVPQDYFDSLPTIVQERCVQTRKPHVFTLWQWLSENLLSPQISFALSILIITLSVVSINKYFVSPNAVDSKITVTHEEIANSTYLDDLDEDILIETLANQNVHNAKKNNKNKEMEDYLIDHDIDVSTIANEL